MQFFKLNKLSLFTATIGLLSGSAFAEQHTSAAVETQDFKDKIIVICEPDDLNCDNPPPPPPPVLPGKPGDFTVYRSGSDNQVEMKWQAAAPGNGFRFRYVLTREEEGQQPHQLYSGTSLTYNHIEESGNNVRYSVQACTTHGCSDLVNSAVYVIAPQASSEDTVTSAVEQFRVNFPNGRTTGQLENALAVLGNGWDDVKGEAHGNHCWDATGEDKLATVEAINEGDYKYVHTEEYKAINELFERQTTYGLSLGYGGFSASTGGAAGVINQTNGIQLSSVIAGDYRWWQNQYNIRQTGELGLKDEFANKLYAGEKFGFRTKCGDQYIDTVTTGAKLNFTIRMDLTEINYDDVKVTTGDLGVALNAAMFDGTLTNTEIDALSIDYGSYKYVIHVSHVGFTDQDNGELVTFDNIQGFLNAFQLLLERDVDDSVVIESTQRHYPIPDGLGDDRYSVFVDPHPARAKLDNWGLLDAKVEERCHMLYDGVAPTDTMPKEVREELVNDNNTAMVRIYPHAPDQKDACDATKGLYNRHAEVCSDQGKWDECFAPKHPSCVDNYITGAICMEHPDNVWKKYNSKITDRMNLTKTNCKIGPCYQEKSFDICYEDGISVPNYLVSGIKGLESYRPDPAPGVITNVIDVYGEQQWATNEVVYRAQDNRFCNHTWAKIKAKGAFGDAGYIADMQLQGYFMRKTDYQF